MRTVEIVLCTIKRSTCFDPSRGLLREANKFKNVVLKLVLTFLLQLLLLLLVVLILYYIGHIQLINLSQIILSFLIPYLLGSTKRNLFF
jgi:hypothetical protein